MSYKDGTFGDAEFDSSGASYTVPSGRYSWRSITVRKEWTFSAGEREEGGVKTIERREEGGSNSHPEPVLSLSARFGGMQGIFCQFGRPRCVGGLIGSPLSGFGWETTCLSISSGCSVLGFCHETLLLTFDWLPSRRRNKWLIPFTIAEFLLWPPKTEMRIHGVKRNSVSGVQSRRRSKQCSDFFFFGMQKLRFTSMYYLV